MIEINLILIFMIVAAVVAVQVKDLLSGVVAVGAVGIGLSMAFLVLKAPDLAIMQLVVEILSLILLIRATVRKDLPFSSSGRWVFNTVSTVIFFIIFISFAYISFKDIPVFGSPIMRVSQYYIEQAASATGFKNLVGALTLDYRILDTIGEAVIVFTVVIGVLAVARKVGHSEES